MARPVQANAAATRRRLVHAALDHFSRCGFEATSLRKVAQEAEVSLATIHYYFRSKTGLYEACMDSLRGSLATGFAPLQEMFALIIERVAGAERDPSSLEAMLAELVRTSFSFAREHQRLLRLIMRPLLEVGELDRRWREETLLPFLDAAAQALAEVTGLPRAEQRFALQSVIAVGMRYALSSPRELAQLNGLLEEGQALDPALASRALKTTEDQLTRLALRVLLNQTAQEQGE